MGIIHETMHYSYVQKHRSFIGKCCSDHLVYPWDYMRGNLSFAEFVSYYRGGLYSGGLYTEHYITAFMSG